MNSKRILVIGATGFIGGHLVNALKSSGHTVYPFSRLLGYDICKKDSFSSFLDKDIDVVFNLAGDGHVPDGWKMPESCYMINTMGTQNALDFCKRVRAKFVYVSSYIYGAPKYLPQDENHPISPNNPYACSKWLGEELCRFYGREQGLNVIILRPFNIFGEGQRECFLIPSIIKQMEADAKIVVRDEIPRRDYLYIADFIDACLLTMDYEDEKFNIFNIGYGASFSVKEVIEIMAECRGKKILWSSLGERRPNEIMETVADCRRIRDAMGWKPRVSFRQGVMNLVNSTEAYKV